MEARVGIEPTHKGFADLSLTTWVPRPDNTLTSSAEKVYCDGEVIFAAKPTILSAKIQFEGSRLTADGLGLLVAASEIGCRLQKLKI